MKERILRQLKRRTLDLDTLTHDGCWNRLIKHCIKHNKFEDLKWLVTSYSIERDSFQEVCDCALYGRLTILKWIHENNPTAGMNPTDDDSPAVQAAGEGHLAIVQWLYSKGMIFSPSVMGTALSNCRLQVAEWLFEQGQDGKNSKWEEWALEKDHLKAFKWILKADPDYFSKRELLELSSRAKNLEKDEIRAWLKLFMIRHFR